MLGYHRVGEIHPAHAFLSLPDRIVVAVPDSDVEPVMISEMTRREPEVEQS